MKKTVQRIPYMLLNDADRKAGNGKDKDGNPFSWAAAYVLTLLPVGSTDGSDIKKLKVHADSEKSIKAQLANIPWGSVLTLEQEDGYVTAVSVEQEWIEI